MSWRETLHLKSSERNWWILVVSTSVAAYPGALLTLAYTFYFVEESPSYLVLSLGLVLPTAFSALSKFWGVPS
ncbi:MAG: hypothetical protein DRJ40_09450 [Thermoprotei archaeon]|nr:MAG: hypothetical protein DRJ40_09450 [Thermoprotei archaeon]